MYKYISKEFVAVFLTSFLIVTPASAQKVNYKTAKLTCTFTHHCYEGRNLKVLPDRRIDFSSCDKVNIPLTWDPISTIITFNSKKRPVLSIRPKRKSISVNTKVGNSYVKFFALSLLPALSFRDDPKASSPITDYYNGTCEVAQ